MIDDRPAYQQLADILRHRTDSDAFTEGEKLPPAAGLPVVRAVSYPAGPPAAGSAAATMMTVTG